MKIRERSRELEESWVPDRPSSEENESFYVQG